MTVALLAPPWRISDLPEVIAAQVVTNPATGEWIWTGRTDRDGYGRIGSEGVHRVVYRLLVGEIPPGHVIDHVRARGCTSRACVSPWCLETVPPVVNTMRGDSPMALNARKAECDHGHEYDLLNTYWRPNGHRDCRKCTARRQREYKQRHRQEQAAMPVLARAA